MKTLESTELQLSKLAELRTLCEKGLASGIAPQRSMHEIIREARLRKELDDLIQQGLDSPTAPHETLEEFLAAARMYKPQI